MSRQCQIPNSFTDYNNSTGVMVGSGSGGPSAIYSDVNSNGVLDVGDTVDSFNNPYIGTINNIPVFRDLSAVINGQNPYMIYDSTGYTTPSSLNLSSLSVGASSPPYHFFNSCTPPVSASVPPPVSASVESDLALILTFMGIAAIAYFKRRRVSGLNLNS